MNFFAAVFRSFKSGIVGTASNPGKPSDLSFPNKPVCQYVPYYDVKGRLKLSQKCGKDCECKNKRTGKNKWNCQPLGSYCVCPVKFYNN